MRVLLVCTLARGGPVEQSLALAAGLRERGVSVAAACTDATVAARMAACGADARELPLGGGLDLARGRAVWVAMNHVDVVHAQDRRAGLWTRLAPGRRAVARVYTVHGLPDPYLPPPLGERRPGVRDRLAYEVVDAALARRADALILPSQALADAFVARLRFPADRMTVVPNGVPIPMPAPTRGDAVGTLSLLEPVKDLATFLRAAARLARDRPRLRFLVAGEGSQRPALQRLADELGLGEAVRFTGYVAAEQALSRLAVLVMPSVFENAPMAVLEAMAAGVPVVASRTGGLPELIGEDAGLLVTPGDDAGFAAAIAELVDDPARAEEISRAGRARATARFSAQANAAATLDVYERVLRGRRD